TLDRALRLADAYHTSTRRRRRWQAERLDTSWWRRGSCPPPFDLHEELGGCLPDGHGPGGVGVYGLGQAAGEHAGLDGEGGLMDEFAATGGNDGRPEDPSPAGVSQDEPGT